VTLRRAFTLGLLAGVVYFTGTLYWITHVMAMYGGLSMWAAVPVNAALIAYLALFPALFAVITRRIVMAHGWMLVMTAPIVWVATELGRTYLLTGFPWVLLGYSQATVLPIAQLASVFGVYGVSMLVASMSAATAFVAMSPARTGRYRRYIPAATILIVVLAVAVWGSRRAAASAWTRQGDPIRVGLVQGNVDQAEKWNPARAAAIFEDYLRLTRQALREGAGFVLWPESSTPFVFEEDLAGAARVRDIARQARAPILFGSDQIEWRTEGSRRTAAKYYNSAFLVRDDGTTGGVYRKMHLVPFGEYVPLQRLLFFAAPLTEQSGAFSPGERAELLRVNGHPASVSICYEVVYPALVRAFVLGGSELLTTITNDAWFGRTSAPYQHFEQASMRAIEEGRYLVRSANTGISGIVDPYGRVVGKTGLFETAVLVGEARFLRASTFYARHGDILAYASVAMTVALLVVSRRRVE
jgi:apolipoprotein N-acyltransferase